MEEKIKAKLEELSKQKEQLMANYNAICGAEQVLMQLINELNEVTENEESKD